MTLNLHKGFGVFNRHFILPAMREAIRAVSADVVLLQEVIGDLLHSNLLLSVNRPDLLYEQS
jgi:endonuclease/exonuclease/phosphatase family metal-dependent hydrolase